MSTDGEGPQKTRLWTALAAFMLAQPLTAQTRWPTRACLLAT